MESPSLSTSAAITCNTTCSGDEDNANTSVPIALNPNPSCEVETSTTNGECYNEKNINSNVDADNADDNGDLLVCEDGENMDSFDSAGGEGYTPLNEMSCGALAVAMEREGGDEGDEGDPTFLYTEYAPMTMSGDGDDIGYGRGFFFSNPLASSPTPSIQEEEVTHNGNIYDNKNINGSENDGKKVNDFDYRSLADQMLRSLDDEYHCSVVGVPPKITNTDTNLPSNSHQDHGHQVTSSESEQCNLQQGHLATSAAGMGIKIKLGKDLQLNLSQDSEAANTLDAISFPSEPTSTATGTDAFPTSFIKEQIIKPDSKRQLPTIDKEAIAKAVSNIRLKSPDLTATLDNWKAPSQHAFLFHKPQTRKPQQHHTIVPSTPLKAFHRSTAKAKAATSNLTRSATIAETFVRLFLPKSCDKKSNTNTVHAYPPEQHHTKNSATLSPTHKDSYFASSRLIIHIVGADHVECDSVSSVQKAVGPFVRWLNAFIIEGRKNRNNAVSITPGENGTAMTPERGLFDIEEVQIELVGPNVPAHAVDYQTINLLSYTNNDTNTDADRDDVEKPIDASVITPRGLVSCTAVCKNCLYHDYLKQLHEQDNTELSSNTENKVGRYPNMAIAFNAGIWGYDLWKPTLDALNKFHCPIPFIITAYTTQEAEDDAFVIGEVIKAGYAYSDGVDVGDESGGVLDKKCLWEAEVNPFGSRKERKTHSAPKGRQYFENHAWQAWLLGENKEHILHEHD